MTVSTTSPGENDRVDDSMSLHHDCYRWQSNRWIENKKWSVVVGADFSGLCKWQHFTPTATSASLTCFQTVWLQCQLELEQWNHIFKSKSMSKVILYWAFAIQYTKICRVIRLNSVIFAFEMLSSSKSADSTHAAECVQYITPEWLSLIPNIVLTYYRQFFSYSRVSFVIIVMDTTNFSYANDTSLMINPLRSSHHSQLSYHRRCCVTHGL